MRLINRKFMIIRSSILRIGAKLMGVALLCVIVCSCMNKHDTGGSAYVAHPYIDAKNGYYTDGALYYDIQNSEGVVIGTADKVREIVIPDYIGINEMQYPLTKVMNLGAFDKDTYETTQDVSDNDNLTTLVIGGNVKSFGQDVLFRKVIYPNGQTDDNNMMRRYSNLENIYVKNGNALYDSRNNCNAIILTANNELILGGKNTVVPAGVQKISASAFRACKGLETISLPSTLELIAPYAFSDSHLKTLDIPVNVVYIAHHAFNGCDSLVSLTLRSDIISIESRAFTNCSSLKDPNSEVKFYSPNISVSSPETVFDEGCNCLLVPEGQLSYFKGKGWEKCFLTIKEFEIKTNK